MEKGRLQSFERKNKDNTFNLLGKKETRKNSEKVSGHTFNPGE